ncbi:MAG: methyltransferase domain-containing protein [Caldilineaceae bacterium]|nr:methyltransferase domain-containing protein [Caldilineaceae bacterium]
MQNRYSELMRDAAAVADSGLTAFGWEQTAQLAQWLGSHEKIDALYTAPLLQSRLTAQRIGQALSLVVNVHEDLPGRFPSDLTLPGQWDRSVRTIDQQPAVSAVDPEAPYGQYLSQLVASLDSIIQENWGKTIAIVLSGNGVATAIRHFAGAHALPVVVSHTGVSELRRQDGIWHLVYVNRREHLPISTLPVQRQKAPVVAPVNGDELVADIARVVNTYGRLVPHEHEESDQPREQRIRHLLKFAQLPSKLSVLDVGTGMGQLALTVAEEGAREVIGIDISPTMLEAAELIRLRSDKESARRVSYRLAPAHALPFRDERFDAIVCRLLLHHSHKPQAILAELARLLRHNGILVVADLLSASDPVKRATQNAIEEKRNPSHVAALSAEQYRKLVTGAGLVIEAEQTITFERELEEWLNDMQADQNARTTVREMIEAGLETDAAGLNARRQGNKLVFDQRMFYLKAIKP